MSRLPPALVVGCTNRKRINASTPLQASSLPFGDQQQVAAEWQARLRSVDRDVNVRDLYCGRGFQEALTASSKFSGPLWVISAGLGLLNSYDRVAGYDLTTSRNSEQSVQRHISSGKLDEGSWWRAINRNRNPLSSLITNEARRGRLFVIALSSQYLELVAEDLLEVEHEHHESLRILSRTELSAHLKALTPCTIVYGDYLDGPDSPIPGTGADFASRMARHFADYVLREEPRGTFNMHHRLLKASLEGLRRPKQTKRIRRSDLEIIDLIHELWERAGGHSSRMLRLLRDEQRTACEQSRFQHLFHLAAAQRTSQ